MARIDSGSKSSRLLASRRYTHDTYTTAQEAFTNVLDLRSEEIFTQAHHITASNLPYSGSSQHGSTLSVGGNEIKKYWYRHKLTPSNVNNEVWFFLSPTGSDDGVGAQLLNANQQTNFISPKYAVSALANATTEDSTPGYLAAVFKSSAVSQSAQTGSLSSGDLVSTNDYQFDYKTGVVQFLNANVDPTDSQYIYMTVYQYVGKTLKTGLEVEGNISGSSISTGSFGQLNAIELGSDISTLISGSTNPAAVSGSWQGVIGSGSLGMFSGSAISTGSFGAVNVAGMSVSNVIDVSSSVSTRTTTLENANISGGFIAQTVLSGSGTLISGSSLSTGSFGSLRVSSPQTLTVDNKGSVSGSATSTGSFGRVLSDTIRATNIVATSTVTAQEFHTEFISASIVYDSGSTKFGDTIDDVHSMTGSLRVSGSDFTISSVGTVSGSATSTGSFGAIYAAGMTNSNLVDVSSSVSTRTTTLENANISGGFVAQTVLSGSGTLFSGSVLSTGSFGALRVTSPQTLTINNTGTVSGSATSTGSFGRVEASLIEGTLVTAAQANITSVGTIATGVWDSSFGSTASTTISGSITTASSSFSTRTTTLENANISGGFVAQTVLSGSGTIFSGSVLSTGSFGSLRVTSPQTLTIDNAGTVSGSATSTGSFGYLHVGGNITASGVIKADAFESVTGGDTISFSDSLNITGDITASGHVSGSVSSTGSFGAINVAGMSVSNLVNVSSSFSTRVTTEEGNVDDLQTDSGSFSTRVGLLEGSGSITESSSSFSTRTTTLENANISGGFVAQTVLSGSGTLISGSVLSTGSFGSLRVAGQALTVNSVGTVSGSATSTGSFGRVIANTTDINGGTIDGATIGATSATTIKGTTIDATTDFTIDGLVLTADTITNDATLTIDSADDMVIDVDGGNLDVKDDSVSLLNISATKVSGSATSTGSFSSLRISSPQTLTVDNKGTVSGSATSTGSFGYLHVGGNITASGTVKADAFESVTGGTTIDFGDSLNITGDITASGHVSGSTTSTGSFGAIDVSGMSVSNLVDVSSSYSTRVTTEESNVDSLQTDSGSFSTRVGLLEGSGSITESSASFSTRVTTEEGNVDDLQTDSGSFSTRVNLLEGSGSITESSSSFSTRTTTLENANISGGFVAQTVLSGSGTLISGSALSTGSFGRTEASTIKGTLVTAAQTNITSVGTIAAGVWDSSFGSTSNTTISGSFTDASSSFSSRVNLLEGSGSITESSSSFSTRTTTLENANISGGFIAQTVLSGSGTLISGSVLSTGSFGSLRVTSPQTLTINNIGTVSGSATSTGSFGAVSVAGMTVSNLLDFSSSVASRITSEEADFTAAGISGSWQGVIGSGSLGMVSGSAISTGSFGRVEASTIKGTLATAAQTNITSVGTITAGVWNSSFGSTANTTISGSFTDASSSFSSRVKLLEGSGSITESSASFSTRITTEEGNVDALQTDSGSFSTRVTTAEASGALINQDLTTDAAVTFATVDTGQGANELYDMDQNVLTTSSPTFVNITATGIVTAEEFHTEFVSASIVYVSGSTKFGDTSDDIHSFTGSIHLTNSGSVSGSSASTGSFGAVNVGGMSVSNLVDVSSSFSTRVTTEEGNVDSLQTDSGSFSTRVGLLEGSGSITESSASFSTRVTTEEGNVDSLQTDSGSFSTRVGLLEGSGSITESSSSFSTRTTTLENANISGGFVAQTVLSGSGTLISGSVLSTGSFGALRVAGQALTVNNAGTVSGSATSTGSFGAIYASGMTVPNLLDFSSSIASRVTTEESDFTAAGISGSWQGVVGSGSLGMVSGSAISTGSFGAVNIAGMTVSNLIDFSSSIASRVTTEESDFTAAGISGSWQGVIGSGSLGMVSGSAISTGSFGKLIGEGGSLSNVTAVPFLKTGSYYSATTDVKITGSLAVSGNISGSYSGLSVGQKYLHAQTSVATTWTITHNFDYQYVNVDVYDSNDQIVIPTSITATDTNTITLTFGSAISGNAIISTGGQARDELGKNKIHNQSTAVTNWRVTHSVGEQYPAVTVYDENDNVIIPQQINAADAQTMDIIFAQPQSGNANFSVGGGISLSAITSSVQLSGVNFGDISGSVTSTGSFGALRVVGPTLKVDNVGTVSGSATSTGSFGSVNVAGMSVSNVIDVSSSIASRATTLEGTGTIQGVGTTNAVTFASVDTGQGANELYDMDQNVLTTSSPTFVNITATGTVTAEEFHTEFVSASIVYVSGSTKFGDTSDDIHSFTGSIHLVNSGSVSGSIFSTGSFGAIYAGGMSVPNLIDVSSSVSTRTTTLENANISGGFVAQTVLSGSGTLISGSSLSTGSFGALRVTGQALTIDNVGIVSGSAISTGSFGAVSVAGMTVSNLIDFSSSIASRVTTEESDFTAAGISGSWQGVVGSGSLGMVSGSAISTGSFGYVNVAGMTTPSILALSSSIETRLNSLSADIIALSIALG